MNDRDFRLSLSISPYMMGFAEQGITYTDGTAVAGSPVELQRLFNRYGASEMWVRINMRRRGEGHAFEHSLAQLRIARELDMPVNAELLCVRDYMDMSRQDTVGFEDFPEIALPRPWEACSLDEMVEALVQYGEIAAREVLDTGCRVSVWDLGNETNFGFAGVNVGCVTAVNPALEKARPWWIIPRPHWGANWLAENVWPHNARLMAAVATGIRAVDPAARVSVHIATAIADATYAVRYFATLIENGFAPDEAGISFYPSTPGLWLDPVRKFKKTVSAIQQALGLKVFVAEYAYPSARMTAGQFKSWNRKARGYGHTEADQARLLQDVIAWGRANGLSGIRPFAPDLNGHWEPMALFSHDEETGVATAKPALLALGGV